MKISQSIWDHETQKRIHYETLKVLKNVGVRVDSDEALEIFHAHGADVIKRKSGGVVYLPEYLIEDCIGWAPKSVIYYARDYTRDFDTKSARVGFSTYGECIQIVDSYTGALRPTTKEDCGNSGKIVDYFDHCAVMERAICSTDMPPETQPLHNLEALLKNTSKHIILGAGNKENFSVMLEMAYLAAGGREIFHNRPILTFSVCPTSPLTLNGHACDVIIKCAEANIGMWMISMVLAGGSGPVALAGSIVQHNAEILSGLALAQLVKNGTPVTYCSSSSILYLKNASAVMGGPEYGMMGRATAQMAKYYDLPTAIAVGVSESKETDVQAAYEAAINLTQVAMNRPPIIYGLGSIENGLTFDFRKLILDCEHTRHLLMAIEGIPVDEYQLAYDDIVEVGPGGSFLMQQKTYDNMRKQSDVMIFDRNSRGFWMKNGAVSPLEKANNKATETIQKHEPMPLPEGAEDDISRLIEVHERKLR